ncbi:DUF4173 domain-containing protein [Candidatus Woesebacteria bacterium]|nr:MAG: DUF4173 domain-containing protein [Candidatus Woesebacteria bacterium]
MGFVYFFVSVLLSYLITNFRYFPYLGFALSALLVSYLIFLGKYQKTLSVKLLFALVVILSVLLVSRSNGFLTFINLSALLYAMSELVLENKKPKSLVSTLLSPFVVFINLLSTKVNLFVSKNDKRNIYFFSVLLSLIILFIITPALMMANPMFNNLVLKLFDNRLTKLIFVDNLFVYIIRTLLVIFFVIFVPRAVRFASKSGKILETLLFKLTPTIRFIIPKVTVIIVLCIFFATQIKLYLSSSQDLLDMGYTNSKYAREIFGQLCFVSLVSFLLIYADKARKTWNQLTSYILILQMFFLNVMALKSVYDYTYNWGFTQKRLYGYTLVVWLFIILVIYVISYLKKAKEEKFLRLSVVVTFATLICINLVNFDKLIYFCSKSKTHQGVDYVYLAQLSADSSSFAYQVKNILADNASGDNLSDRYQAMSILFYKINDLENEYENPDFRSFNINRYLEYKRVKDIDKVKIEDFLNSSSHELTYQVGNPNTDNRVNVTIENLPANLVNANFYVKYLDVNTVLQEGSLDNISYLHRVGQGNFIVTLERSEMSSDGKREKILNEIPYSIYSNEVEKGELTVSY